jgi:uronate dehydrogenase
VVGFHQQDELLGTDCLRRPDSYYGLSKSFGEDVAQFYWNRYGIQSASMRIGSAFPEPKDRRMLHTWLSYRDLTELIRCCLETPQIGHTVVFGMSDNRDPWWNNAGAAHLGFKPQDSAEPYRADREATPPLDPMDPARRYQGGSFVKSGPFN